MYQSVLQWLEETEGKYTDKVIFKDSESAITFQEAKEKAKRLGSSLIGVSKPRKPVAVLSGRNIYTPVTFLGILYSGSFYAPLDGSMPDYRLSQIMDVLQPEILVTDNENYDKAVELGKGCRILKMEELFDNEPNEESLMNIRRQAQITDPLYVIFTSGSTGKPKGVITSHQSLMTYVDSYLDVMNITDEDILGNQSPLDYIAAIRDIYIPLRTGASTFIIPKECFLMPAKLFDVLNEEKITALGWSVSALTVPVSMNAFEYTVPRYLRKICFSGSVMPCSVLRVWQEKLPEAVFVNQYGPTEATASCTYYVVDHMVAEDEVLPIGRAYKNYRVFLLSEDNREVPQGETGEICVCGPILALAYYNDEERTRQSFIQNPLNTSYNELIYKTGDLGSFNEEGILEFHGRKDRQIKFMGHRVELDEIEVAASAVDGLYESCAIFIKEKEQIALFYTGENITKKDITLKLREMLPSFMIPRKVIQLEEMPRLANGKTDMKKLSELFRSIRS